MENLNATEAVALIKIALQSGSIKLLGPDHQNTAETRAKADAKYLLTLLAQLQGTPSGQ